VEDARAPIAEAIDIHRASLGEDHPQVAMDLIWQAMIEVHAGRLAEAERDGREALGRFTKATGLPATDRAWMNVFAGSVLAAAGKLDEADTLLAEAVATGRSEPRDPTLLGRALVASGDVARQRHQAERAAALGR